jgi:hypothetical protein
MGRNRPLSLLKAPASVEGSTAVAVNEVSPASGATVGFGHEASACTGETPARTKLKTSKNATMAGTVLFMFSPLKY